VEKLTDARGRLVAFLDHAVFDPVLRATPEGKSEIARRKLAQVKTEVRAERARFRACTTGSEIKTRYEDDLETIPTQRLRLTAHRLGLPALGDVREEFETLCDELGVM